MSVDFIEPTWLIEPSEPDLKVVDHCQECETEIYDGSTVYQNCCDFSYCYCSQECFLAGEMVMKEVYYYTIVILKVRYL